MTGVYSLGPSPSVMANVNGNPEYGMVFAQRNKTITYNNILYANNIVAAYLDANGNLNDGNGNQWIDVVPDANATPGDSYYVVTINIQGAVHSEIWIVPDQASVSVLSVRQTSAPASGGTSTPVFFYQMVQQSGAGLTQRPALNLAGSGVSCSDNAAQQRTDCTITGGSGSGTVTSFSASGLSPLFTTSVATATTTPALSFTLSNAGAHAFLGNHTGSSGAPAYVRPACGDLSDASGGCTMSTTAGGDLSGTLPSPTVANINGTSVPTNGAADQTIITTASATGAWKSVSNCGDSTHALSYSTGTHAFGCQAITASATAGGSSGQVQWNNSTALAGITNLTTTGTITTALAGADWLFADPTDSTKKAQLDLSGIATSTTRTVTVPNANSTLVVADTGASNNFLTAISAAGAISKAQPAFSNLSGSATCGQLPALTGDVTSSAGSCATTNANLPDGVTQAGSLLVTDIAAPSSPAAAHLKLFGDSTDLRFHDKNAAGTIGTTVVADTGASNNYISAISAAGVISKNRPTCSTLSDSAASCSTDATNASNISSGTIGAARLGSAHNVETPMACADSSGSGTAQTCNTSPTFTPASGDKIIYSTTTTNTADVTVNVNSLGAKHIRKWSAAAVLASGDLVANVPVTLIYDGTYWEIGTIGNAPSGSGTVTVVGAGSLTSTALVTGGGSQTLQTPSATSTLDSSGNMSLAGKATATEVDVSGSGDLKVTATGTNNNVVLVPNGSGKAQVADGSDTTKLASFDVSNIATATTRTVNVPNANSTTVQSDTGASNNFLTAISAQGVISKAQPAFSNLSGSATCGQLPALTGDATTSAGSCATTIASSAVTASKVDATVKGYSAVNTSSVNAVAATDVQLKEFALAAGYLNTANAVTAIRATGTWTTGTTQTPTWNFKIKLCTVSGCGSGTVLTLLSWTSAASTASTTETWILSGDIGTTATGSSGTLLAHGFADLPVGASANTAFAGLHDVNTAASSAIDLTAALFLDVTFNASTQSGTKNSCTYHTAKVEP